MAHGAWPLGRRASEHLEQARSALSAADTGALKTTAHSLKGSCGNMGIVRLAELSRLLVAASGTSAEAVEILKSRFPEVEITPRSLRLNSSAISMQHPFVRRALLAGYEPFGSPTLSDQALMPFPSVKMGPGDSSRSHTADEYIILEEIREAIEVYICLLDRLQIEKSAQ